MSDSPEEIPTFAELAADPEIAALLDFAPAERKIKRANGWTPQLQRELIARLAVTGSVPEAAEQMRRDKTGAANLYRDGDDSFRAAWDAALELGRRRRDAERPPPFLGEVPGMQRAWSSPQPSRMGEGGQVRNEHGEWEDEESLLRRAEEARDSISNKLIRARRLYLQEISPSPGKRAAFEILTELPIDWDRAERLEPQPDEPWRNPNMRQPDMLLTAEAGWLGAELVHGRDKLAELRAAIDEHRAAEGLPAVNWGEDDLASPRNGEGDHPQDGGGAGGAGQCTS